MKHVEVLIASYLEPAYVDRIRQIDGVRVTYHPALLPLPRYGCDHVGHTLQRSPEDEQRWRTYLAGAEALFDFDHTNLAILNTLIPNVRWLQATSAGIGQLLIRTGLIAGRSRSRLHGASTRNRWPISRRWPSYGSPKTGSG